LVEGFFNLIFTARMAVGMAVGMAVIMGERAHPVLPSVLIQEGVPRVHEVR